MQCAFSTASCPAMTLHLEDHHPIAPAASVPQQPYPKALAGKVWERWDGEDEGPPR